MLIVGTPSTTPRAAPRGQGPFNFPERQQSFHQQLLQAFGLSRGKKSLVVLGSAVIRL